MKLPDGERLEESRHRGQVEGRRDAGRVPRQLQIQSARPARARVQHRPCRCWRSGTTTRSPTTGRRRNRSAEDKRYTVKAVPLLAARAARAFHEFMPIAATPQEAARVYRKVAYGPLLDIFFLDMRTYRGPNTDNRQSAEGPDTVFLGRDQIAWLKRELIGLARDLEGDRCRHAAVAHRVRQCRRPHGSEAIAQGDGPAARARVRVRRAVGVHQAGAGPQHRLADRRRALYRGALLRPGQGGVPGFRTVLGIRLRSAPRRDLRPQPRSTTPSARSSGT